jgi:hypothetical protein
MEDAMREILGRETCQGCGVWATLISDNGDVEVMRSRGACNEPGCDLRHECELMLASASERTLIVEPDPTAVEVVR